MASYDMAEILGHTAEGHSRRTTGEEERQRPGFFFQRESLAVQTPSCSHGKPLRGLKSDLQHRRVIL